MADAVSTAGPAPDGCRWCGVEHRAHAQRWSPNVGLHAWFEPTSAQRFARMVARRARRAVRNDR